MTLGAGEKRKSSGKMEREWEYNLAKQGAEMGMGL